MQFEKPPEPGNPGETRTGEMSPGEMSPAEMGPGELRPGEMIPGEKDINHFGAQRYMRTRGV